MQIVDVIPFSKNLRKEGLSYFTTRNIPIGSIVSVEVRNKTVQGLVIAKREGKNLKEQLKTSSFKMKKVKGVSANVLFRKEFILASKETADYFAVSTGAVIGALNPTKIFDDIKNLEKPQELKESLNKEEGQKYIIQDKYDERYSNYKSLIRGELAKKSSTLFICPTVEDCLNAEKLLFKGIEGNTFLIHNKLTKNQIIKKWNEIISHSKPCVIITTGNFLGIPRHDIGLLIVEKESSSAYRTMKSPYIDIRLVAEYYAKSLGSKILFGDLMLRSETLLRYDNHEFYEQSPLKFRALSGAKQLIIDMKKDKNNAGDLFSILSSEVKGLVKETKYNNEHTFLYASRKGLAPSIVCADCGTIVKCSSCSAPVVLHGKTATEKQNFFKCHVCGETRDAGEKCINCDGWRLKTLGIGVEAIEKELKKEFKDNKYFILDKERARTPKQAREIVEKFYETPGSTLVGTEMAILYLKEAVENIAVVSIDSLFSIPDFAIREITLNLLLKMRSRANHNFYIQSRKASDPIFKYATHGNLADFYRDEFKDRNQFNYPPFSLIIKLTLTGTEKAVEKEFEKIAEFLKPHELVVYPAFTPRVRGKFVMNGIIKLKRSEWIDKNLRDRLRKLPPQVKLVVDAHSLL